MQITWSDKGKGKMRSFSNDEEANKFLNKLKRSATIYRNHVKIGEVWKNDGKYTWAYESEEIK